MTRPSAHRRGYTRGWQAITRDAIAVHVRVYGWTCPGWGVPAHRSADLTLDHELPVSRGGLSTRANAGAVLCRACNSRKGATPPPRVQLTFDLDAPTSSGPGSPPAPGPVPFAKGPPDVRLVGGPEVSLTRSPRS